MKKIYIILISVLFILTAFSVYIFISKDFKVTIIYPPEGIFVSTNFPAFIIVSPFDEFKNVEIEVNGRLKDRIAYEDLRILRLGNNAFINLPVTVEGEHSGNKDIDIIFNRKFLSPKYRLLVNTKYFEFPDITETPDNTEIKRVEDFFSTRIQDLIIILNTKRIDNPDWKNDVDYLRAKESTRVNNLPEDIKKAFFVLVETFENDSGRIATANASNYLNYILLKSGYPVLTVLLENEFENGLKRTVLFTYKIIETSVISSGGISEKVYLLERMDKFAGKELFSGIITEHSPVCMLINEVVKKNSEELEVFLSDAKAEAGVLTRKYTHYYIKNEAEINKIIRTIVEEAEVFRQIRDASRKNIAYEITKLSTATHEAKHLADYRTGFPFAKCITEILPYFFGNEILTESKTDIKRLIKVYDVFSRINPEYSAYLFSLAYADGGRKYQLLKLLDFILNEYYEDNQYQWAAKLIYFRLGAKTEIDAKKILTEAVEGNEKEWVEIFKRAAETDAEELGKIFREIYKEDFGK
ncbi:MAG: hypothetical protein JW917_05445 [Ignavibacteria bacterium]|nr:hypothetical protein [Ignavibacteria bacterium]